MKLSSDLQALQSDVELQSLSASKASSLADRCERLEVKILELQDENSRLRAQVSCAGQQA